MKHPGAVAIGSGVALFGVAAYFIWRKPSSSPTQTLIAAQTGQNFGAEAPTPQQQQVGITDQQLIAQGATGGTSDS
jgi:hypothetical protein